MKAYELLDKPEKWIQNDSAKDWMGDACHADSEDACQFSLFGALCRTTVGPKELLEKVLTVGKAIDCETITSWNDNPERTYDDVFMLLLGLGF